MFTVSSVYHGRETVEVITPYNPNFVDAIKMQIPAPYRRWDPESKTWVVSTPYDAVAIRILQFYFPGAEVGERPGERPAYVRSSACQCDADHRALYVCQDAPLEVVKAVYRVLAKRNHPDAGGDHERMQAINTAYARLTSEVRT